LVPKGMLVCQKHSVLRPLNASGIENEKSKASREWAKNKFGKI